MRFRCKDPKKISMILCAAVLVVCAGFAVYAAITRKNPVVFVFPGCLAVPCILVLLAGHNRKTTLHIDTFVYRTWLGKEYTFRYQDVLWYHAAAHEVWAYTQRKRLVVDSDSENGSAFAARLAAFGVPDHSPEEDVTVTDGNGEKARRVLYLEQRKSMFWLMLSLTFLVLVLGAALIIYGYTIKDPLTGSPAIWFLGCGVVLPAAGYLLYSALFQRNVRVELYRDHFIYRTAFMKRKQYAYSDCVFCRLKRYPNEPNRFKAHVRMKDGRKIVVDEKITREGFGAAIGIKRWLNK